MRPMLALLLAALPLHAADDDIGYFPLKVGAKWHYRVSGQETKFTIFAAAEERVGNISCVRLDASLGNQQVGSEHVALQKDGFYRYKFNDLPIEPALCFCKFGVKKGDEWQASFKIGDSKTNVRYDADFQDVKVPAGEFKNALVIKAVASEKVEVNGKETERLTKTTIWFSKGKGIVKQYVELGETKVTLELESIEEGKK